MVHLEFNLTSVLMLLEFALLAFFLYKFLYKPFFKISDERRKRIQEDFNVAEKAKLEAEASQKEAKKLLDNAITQAEGIMANAKKTAEDYALREREDAKQKAESMLKKAQEEIEAQKQDALKEISEKSVSLAVYLASKLLERQVDEKAQNDYLKSFLSKIKEGGGR
ncbi:MAG: F0F1 ATP synthase subunit B [Thermotogae bacterium]|nr:F0F1 ATP synthase subunit B [Thermotogota bacterium]